MLHTSSWHSDSASRRRRLTRLFPEQQAQKAQLSWRRDWVSELVAGRTVPHAQSRGSRSRPGAPSCGAAGSGRGWRDMIGRLNHVAIAVPDLEAAAATYRSILGADVKPPQAEPDHGVTVVFIELPNTKIELLEPLGGRFADQGVPGEEPVRRDPPRLLRGRRHPRRARSPEGLRRARAWIRRAEDRRPRQAGAVPASQGLQRDAGGTGAGLRARSSPAVTRPRPPAARAPCPRRWRARPRSRPRGGWSSSYWRVWRGRALRQAAPRRSRASPAAPTRS